MVYFSVKKATVFYMVGFFKSIFFFTVGDGGHPHFVPDIILMLSFSYI